MRLTRVYVDAALEPGMRVTLAGSAASHITRVLRLRPGAALTLFNGRGGEYAGNIEHSDAGKVTVALSTQHAVERESPLALTLAQGVSRGERMDLVVQKATELGVSCIAPLLTERSVVRLDPLQSARKVAHWRGIAIAACEQSGRNRVPEVATPLALREFTGIATAVGAAGARLLLSPAAALRLDDVAPPVTEVTVLIGPEGGLTDSEEELARTAGFTPVRLGPRVLRTETAAIAALALLQRNFGDL
jgi:16S rRNA (uracil1498-N3)-methyltransferase